MSLNCSKVQEFMRIVRIRAILKTFLLSSPFCQNWYPNVNWPMLSIDELLLHFVWPISCIVWKLFLAFINNLVVMDCSTIFSITLLTVSKFSSDEFRHLKTIRILGFLCFYVNPLSLFNRNKVPTTCWWRVFTLVSLLQRFSPTLSLPLGSAWLLWQICQYRSQF